MLRNKDLYKDVRAADTVMFIPKLLSVCFDATHILTRSSCFYKYFLPDSARGISQDRTVPFCSMISVITVLK